MKHTGREIVLEFLYIFICQIIRERHSEANLEIIERAREFALVIRPEFIVRTFSDFP
jgi:hypothetical protein